MLKQVLQKLNTNSLRSVLCILALLIYSASAFAQNGSTEFELRLSHSNAKLADQSQYISNIILLEFSKLNEKGLLKWGFEFETDPQDNSIQNDGKNESLWFPTIDFKIQFAEFEGVSGISITPTVHWSRHLREDNFENTVLVGVEASREWEREVRRATQLTIEAVGSVMAAQTFSPDSQAKGTNANFAAEFRAELERQFQGFRVGSQFFAEAGVDSSARRRFEQGVELWYSPGASAPWKTGVSLRSSRVWNALPGINSEREIRFFVSYSR